MEIGGSDWADLAKAPFNNLDRSSWGAAIQGTHTHTPTPFKPGAKGRSITRLNSRRFLDPYPLHSSHSKKENKISQLYNSQHIRSILLREAKGGRGGTGIEEERKRFEGKDASNL